MFLIAYTDGASPLNPGPAAIGISFQNAAGEELAALSQSIGEATNNQAEYCAVTVALQGALTRGATEIEVRSDSAVVVGQLNGAAVCRHPGLIPFFQQIQDLRPEFAACRFVHIPRAENRRADALAAEPVKRWRVSRKPGRNAPVPAERGTDD